MYILGQRGVDDASLLAATTEATGHDVEWLTDMNRNTWWESTTTATHYVSGTWASTYGANAAAIYHDLPINTTVRLQYENAGWNTVGGVQTITAANTPMLLVYFGASYTSTQWRLNIQNLSSVAKINIWSLGVVRIFNTKYNYGTLIGNKIFNSRIVEGYGGMRAAVNYAPERKLWVLKYEAINVDEKNSWVNLIADVEGIKYPMFMLDENSEYAYVRMMQDLNWIEFAAGYYNIPSIRLEEEL